MQVLSRNYKHNLENLWIVHPTMWIKMAFFFCSPFLDSSVTAKVAVCPTLAVLQEDFEEGGLPLPPEVYDNDRNATKGWFT